jgi:hypothetical protein
MKWASPIAVALLVSACGGGGGGGSGGGGGLPVRPQVVLVCVSGHNGLLDGDPSPSYLQYDAGPEVANDLDAAGYDVRAAYFADDAFAVGPYGGYLDLVNYIEALRDSFVPFGGKVVILAHSHGGVWAHGAIRAVPDLPIAAEVDLDLSSYGWDFVDHDLQNAYLGGDPRNDYYLGVDYTVTAYPSVPSETGGWYDLEDVVFANVTAALEVRSGDSPLLGEWYDERWNARASGSTEGLYAYYSGTSHGEVHAAGGSTLAVVRNWLRARLAE